MSAMKYYVYRHVRKDTFTPFYIGSGKDRRAHISGDRNHIWQSKLGKPAHNKGKPGLAGENHPMFEKTHTIEARKKIGDSCRGKPWTEARRVAHSARKAG
jgi:hypothetical protein